MNKLIRSAFLVVLALGWSQGVFGIEEHITTQLPGKFESFEWLNSNEFSFSSTVVKIPAKVKISDHPTHISQNRQSSTQFKIHNNNELWIYQDKKHFKTINFHSQILSATIYPHSDTSKLYITVATIDGIISYEVFNEKVLNSFIVNENQNIAKISWNQTGTHLVIIKNLSEQVLLQSGKFACFKTEYYCQAQTIKFFEIKNQSKATLSSNRFEVIESAANVAQKKSAEKPTVVIKNTPIKDNTFRNRIIAAAVLVTVAALACIKHFWK